MSENKLLGMVQLTLEPECIRRCVALTIARLILDFIKSEVSENDLISWQGFLQCFEYHLASFPSTPSHETKKKRRVRSRPA